MHPRPVDLDPTLHSPQVLEIERKLLARTIGQPQAVDKFINIIETFFAGYCNPGRPVGTILELGPTGTGKASLVGEPGPSVLPATKTLAHTRRSHSQADPPPHCPSPRFERRQLKPGHSPLQVFPCIPTSCWLFPLTGAEHHNRNGTVNRASSTAEELSLSHGRRDPSSRG
jgi:hypothetical protein